MFKISKNVKGKACKNNTKKTIPRSIFKFLTYKN